MIEPIRIGDATLYHGDALVLMKELAAAGVKAHMLCCDPPYLLTSGGCTPKYEGARRMGGVFNSKNYDNGGHLVACDLDWNDFMPLFYDILEEQAHAYVMANNRNVQAMLNAARWPSGEKNTTIFKALDALKAAVDVSDRRPLLMKLRAALDAKTNGFEFHNLLVWDKITATPNRWYMKNCEFTGLFYKGNAKAINDCSSMSCIRYAHADDSQHPTEKPVALMEMYIRNSTQPGEIVIDPFMGSGSTGVAAIRAGRKFIGMELEKRWFDTACQRIESAGRHIQTDMF